MGRTKFIFERDIINALMHTHSNREAARYLRISYNHYKKYAETYFDDNGISLFQKHKNQRGSGIKKQYRNYQRTKYPLEDVFAGKFPMYSLRQLKKLKRLSRKPI